MHIKCQTLLLQIFVYNVICYNFKWDLNFEDKPCSCQTLKAASSVDDSARWDLNLLKSSLMSGCNSLKYLYMIMTMMIQGLMTYQHIMVICISIV